MPIRNSNAPALRDLMNNRSIGQTSRYPHAEFGVVSAACQQNRHGHCTKLNCACECCHGEERVKRMRK